MLQLLTKQEFYLMLLTKLPLCNTEHRNYCLPRVINGYYLAIINLGPRWGELELRYFGGRPHGKITSRVRGSTHTHWLQSETLTQQRRTRETLPQQGKMLSFYISYIVIYTSVWVSGSFILSIIESTKLCNGYNERRDEMIIKE